MKKRSLVFVVNRLSFFLSHRLSLAKAAQQAGYEIHVAAPPQSDYFEYLAKLGFYFHPIPFNRGTLNPWYELKSFYSLLRLYRTLKPVLVHHLTIKPIIYGGIAARLAQVPAVVHAVTGLGHLFIAQTIGIKLLRGISRIGFYSAFHHPNMRVIFQNHEDQREFIQSHLLKPKMSVVIRGSGVSLNQYRLLPQLSASKPVVLLPSRLLWEKGIGEFVQAASRLHRQLSIRMVLAGELDFGNPSAISEQQLTLWVESGLVEYWGFQPDIQLAFSHCHLVCLPSYREGVPRVLIEAAACGRPIIATDVPGCRDIVVHGENGLLVEVKNPDALAYSIAQLVKDSKRCQRMGQCGRNLVAACFSDSLINKETLSLYQKLM